MDQERRVALEAVLKRVTIREPFRSWFNPRLSVGLLHPEGGGNLLVTIDTYYADTGQPMPGWTNPFPFSAYMEGRFQRDPRKLGVSVVEAVLEFLRHEAHESVLFDGAPAITPVHNNAGPVG